MKRRVLFIIFVSTCLTCWIAKAESQKKQQVQQFNSEVCISKSEMQQIIEIIERINEMQDSTYQQRDRAILARKKGVQDEESHEFGVISEVEKNTRFDYWKNGWNIIATLALIVAILTLIATIMTLQKQSKTEEHTQKAPEEAQKGVLRDLPRHFYRNLACTSALLLKFRHRNNIKYGKRLQYPSESNILKLTTLPDEFILPIDSTDADVYQKMHEEKLLFKNYNMEVEVAAKHFALKYISDNSLQNDYDNLLFKPLYLTTRMFELQDKISEKDGERIPELNAPYALYAIVKEHFEKVDYDVLIKNKNKEVDFLKSILSDDGFTKSIGVIPDSIERSLKKLLKYRKDDGDVVAFLHRNRKPNKDFDGKGTINREKFEEFFKKNYELEEKPRKRGTEYLDKIMKVVDAKSFYEVFYERPFNKLNKKESAAITKFYGVMEPYFNVFHKENCYVKELVFTILKVDTVLEISKIGMIDYKKEG